MKLFGQENYEMRRFAETNRDVRSISIRRAMIGRWFFMFLGLFGALRILSADVVTDPIFGLFGYGSDVSMAGGCYSVTPKDGVFNATARAGQGTMQ